MFGCCRWAYSISSQIHTNTWRRMAQLHILLSILGTISWATEVEMTAPPVDIYWNRTNSIFERSNNEHIVTVQYKEQIRFLCPFYDTVQDNMEHYIIYRMPKQYFDSCHIPVNANENQLRTEYGIEKVHNCSSPNAHSVYLSFIDNFLPLPGGYGGLVYESGQEYYFTSISTGSLTGLHNRLSESSACKQYNMKAIVRVCCSGNFTDPPIVTADPNAPSTQPTTRPPSTVTPTTISWTDLKTTIKVSRRTTVKGGGKEPQVGDNSSQKTVVSLSILLAGLILGLAGMDCT